MPLSDELLSSSGFKSLNIDAGRLLEASAGCKLYDKVQPVLEDPLMKDVLSSVESILDWSAKDDGVAGRLVRDREVLVLKAKELLLRFDKAKGETDTANMFKVRHGKYLQTTSGFAL